MKTGISVLMLGCFLWVSHGSAALVGTDNASANAYNDGWDNGYDGSITGDGAFGAWSLSTLGGVGSTFFCDNSTTLGAPGANINTGGRSFGMSGPAGYAFAQRSFGSPLAVGQVFSIDLAVNDYIYGIKGINLKDGDNETRFNFNVAGSDYRVGDATTGNGSIGNAPHANTAFRLSFTQTGSGGGTWTIVRSGGIESSTSGTYAGTAAGFQLYIGATNGGEPTRSLFANNLSVTAVPEASTVLFGAIVCLACGGKFASRKLAKARACGPGHAAREREIRKACRFFWSVVRGPWSVVRGG